MSNAYREASSPPRLDTAHMASKSDRASGSADDPFAVDQADATGQCLYGSAMAGSCLLQSWPPGRTRASACPAEPQELKPVVFDLIGPPGPGRHDAADRRQAGLDEIGRIERHAGAIASALERCESVFTRHGRSAANWNARSRNRGSRMLFTVQNCELMLRATALGRMQNLHLRRLLPGHGTQPDACCVPFCDLDGAAQIWPPSRVHSVRSAGGVGPGSDLRSRSHQHEWRFSTRAASVHRTGV